MNDKHEQFLAADQEAFVELGGIVAKLFAGAIRQAQQAAGVDAARRLVRSYQDGCVRAVVPLDPRAAAVSFELRCADGQWRPLISLNGEVPPELRPN